MEEQFILRLPLEQANKLREMLRKNTLVDQLRLNFSGASPACSFCTWCPVCGRNLALAPRQLHLSLQICSSNCLVKLRRRRPAACDGRVLRGESWRQAGGPPVHHRVAKDIGQRQLVQKRRHFSGVTSEYGPVPDGASLLLADPLAIRLRRESRATSCNLYLRAIREIQMIICSEDGGEGSTVRRKEKDKKKGVWLWADRAGACRVPAALGRLRILSVTLYVRV